MKFSLRHQSTGLIYNILANPIQLGLCVFFRRIHYYNRLGVPSDKPVLLAVNHPTAFIDPLLLCCFLDPPIYNMTRGDIFRKPFYRKLMESCNMFPVFRVKDGYTEQNRNDAVNEYVFKKLSEGRIVTIYVEGEHHLDKRVRPIQKGITRLAFGALETGKINPEELQIIPVGVNYFEGDTYRDEVMVNVGEPILVSDYWQTYQAQPNVALSKLSGRIFTELKKLCLHIEHQDDDALAERLLQMDRSEQPLPLIPPYLASQNRFLSEKKVVDGLNSLRPEQKETLRGKVNNYFSKLDRLGINDNALMNPQNGNPLWILYFILGFVPFLIGRIAALPYSVTAKKLTASKVAKKEFLTSVLFGSGVLIALIWYILIFVFTLFTKNPFWIGTALLLPFLGWFAVLYADRWKLFSAAKKANNSPQKKELLAERKLLSVNP